MILDTGSDVSHLIYCPLDASQVQGLCVAWCRTMTTVPGGTGVGKGV